MKEFLTKKFGGLPVWAWALIGAAGIGAGYLLIRWQGSKSNTPAALTAGSTPDLTTGNASGQETNSPTGTVGGNGVINNPFPESTVNGQQVPVVPPGYQAIYDSNGNIVGWGPAPTNPTPAPSGTPPPSSTPPPVSTQPTAGPIPAPSLPSYTRTARARGTGDPGYDRSAAGLPWSGPGLIPFGATVTTSTPGADATGKIQVTYNGQTGYMNVWDLSSAAMSALTPARRGP